MQLLSLGCVDLIDRAVDCELPVGMVQLAR